MQSVVEAAFGYVQNQVKGLFPSAGPLIAPMALTIFVWVFLMNSMDLVRWIYSPSSAFTPN